MFQIVIEEDVIIIRDAYKIIPSTTTVKNLRGEVKKYYSYNCSLPYSFYEMMGFPDVVYIYERLGRTYITSEEPPDYYVFKKVSLQTRKNQGQKTSKENADKKWAKLMTIPKDIFEDVGSFCTLHYELHCNKRDFVTNRMGLLELFLSKREL